MKDNFSTKSDNYAKYRPQYPKAFFEYLNSMIDNKESVWDCGTGSGQIANVLSDSFKNVYATDISQSQINQAIKKINIEYTVQSAEENSFENEQFDLIVVAQAIHWFDFFKFYKEVNRTLKKNGFICVVGYGRIEISKEIDPIINNFYVNVIGSYWDIERQYIDEEYKTIPFPFREIQTPPFFMDYYWTLEHLIGYLSTWSAVKHFISKNQYNPVDELVKELEPYWSQTNDIRVSFPLFVRLGQL